MNVVFVARSLIVLCNIEEVTSILVVKVKWKTFDIKHF